MHPQYYTLGYIHSNLAPTAAPEEMKECNNGQNRCQGEHFPKVKSQQSQNRLPLITGGRQLRARFWSLRTPGDTWLRLCFHFQFSLSSYLSTNLLSIQKLSKDFLSRDTVITEEMTQAKERQTSQLKPSQKVCSQEPGAEVSYLQFDVRYLVGVKGERQKEKISWDTSMVPTLQKHSLASNQNLVSIPD